MTVVEDELDEPTAMPPVLVFQDAKENGPVGDVTRGAATPLSSQPSPVGDDMVMGTVPKLAVVRVHGPLVPAIESPETELPAQVLDEYDSDECGDQDADQDGDDDPAGKL